MSTQGHRVTGKLELVQSFCCKLSAAKSGCVNQLKCVFVMAEYVKEMTEKKSCKYGEYGSFEHVLFLL